MKYSGHVAGDSCCKSADRGRSHQLDTFAARISVSKVFQQRNHCVRVRVCVWSVGLCLIVHSLDTCLVDPFWHIPSENQAFFSKASHSWFSTSKIDELKLGKKKWCDVFTRFLLSWQQIPKFPVLSYQFPIAGSDWKAEVGNFEAGGCRVGITLPVAISHGVRTAESGNPTTHIQICSLIVFQQYDLTCFSHVLIRFICFQHVPTISNTVVVGWRSSE